MKHKGHAINVSFYLSVVLEMIDKAEPLGSSLGLQMKLVTKPPSSLSAKTIWWGGGGGGGTPLEGTILSRLLLD